MRKVETVYVNCGTSVSEIMFALWESQKEKGEREKRQKAYLRTNVKNFKNLR